MIDALLLALGVEGFQDTLSIEVGRRIGIRSRVRWFRRATGRLWAFYGAVHDLVALVKLRLELCPKPETGKRPSNRASFRLLDVPELELLGGAALVAGSASLVNAVLIDRRDGGLEDGGVVIHMQGFGLDDAGRELFTEPDQAPFDF